MSINSVTTISSQNLSLSSSSKTSDNLEYQAILNEALNVQLADNQNASGIANLSTDSGASNSQSAVGTDSLPTTNKSYSYAQTTISFYQTSNVNSSSLSTLLSQATNNEDYTSSNGINATKPSEYGYKRRR